MDADLGAGGTWVQEASRFRASACSWGCVGGGVGSGDQLLQLRHSGLGTKDGFGAFCQGMLGLQLFAN